MSLSPKMILAAARIRAAELQPYMTEALYNLVPHPMPGLGTMGVTKRAVLMYDPATVERWGVEFTAGVLLHEVGHVVRDHATRATICGSTDHAMWNCCADAEQNDDLVAAKIKLPDTPMLPSNLGDRYGVENFPNGKLAEEYYAQLRQRIADKPPPPPPPPQPPQDGDQSDDEDESDDSGDEGDEGDDADSDDGDNDGDGDGTGDDGEPQGGKSDGQKPGDSDGGGQSDGEPGDDEQDGGGSGGSGGGEQQQPPKPPGTPGGTCGSAAGNPLPNEPTEEEAPGRSEAEQNAMRRSVAEAIKKAASSGQGNIPGSLVAWAETMLKPPVVRWQDKLRRVIRRSMAIKAGATDYSFSRPARRQGGIGFGPNKPILPALRAPVPKVSVWVDTSGSMGTDELTRAVSEVAAILKVASEVEFVASDAKVHTVQRVRRWQDLSQLMIGGGGTDFRPVFKALTDKSRPDIIVGITDGIGPAPEVAPAGVTVIWVLVGKHRRKPYSTVGTVEWGEFIEVE